jgi:hypothetical protein
MKGDASGSARLAHNLAVIAQAHAGIGGVDTTAYH